MYTRYKVLMTFEKNIDAQVIVQALFISNTMYYYYYYYQTQISKKQHHDLEQETQRISESKATLAFAKNRHMTRKGGHYH